MIPSSHARREECTVTVDPGASLPDYTQYVVEYRDGETGGQVHIHTRTVQMASQSSRWAVQTTSTPCIYCIIFL